MGRFISFFLLLISVSSYAESIKCYSGNKLIYYKNVKNVTYTGDLFVFEEIPNNKIIMINATCVYKF